MKHWGIKYPCSLCEYKATGKGILSAHQKAVHDQIKIKCFYCDYQATQQSKLKDHIKSMHEGET